MPNGMRCAALEASSIATSPAATSWAFTHELETPRLVDELLA